MRVKKNARGFLLIDVLFSVFVVTAALVVLIAAVSPVIRLQSHERNQVIATQLAQEGLEIMRAKRDVKLRTKDSSGDFTCTDSNDCSHLAQGYYNEDYKGVSCGGSNPASKDLFIDNANGLYNCSNNGDRSSFNRSVFVASDGVTVTSVVSFGTPSQSVTLTDTLSDWGEP